MDISIKVENAQPPSKTAAHELGPRLRNELGADDNMDLLVYFHVPFCNSKCIFCDWVTPIPVRQLRSGPDIRSQYTDALTTQVKAVGPILTDLGYKPRHIYWGGGTPTKLEGEQFEQVIDALHEVLPLDAIGEHTVEATPETLSTTKLERLHEIGVNRLSIGVQSMDDHELRKIGRAHSSQQAADAVAMARSAGLKNINLDIILAFPGQNIDSVITTVNRVLESSPDHITVYIYRPSPGTKMAAQIDEGKKATASLKNMLDFFNIAKLILEEAGYFEYSFGYFAKTPDKAFKGEEYYFGLLGDYIGFGSGARSIVGHHMLENTATGLHDFLEQPAAFDKFEKFSPHELDDILPSLRMTMLTSIGLNYKHFRRLFGFEFKEIENDPFIISLLDYFCSFGTEFERTETAIKVRDENRARAYIMSLLRAFAPMKASESKINEAFNQLTSQPVASGLMD